MKKEFMENTKKISIYKDIFQEFYRVLSPTKYCVLHVGVVGRFNMGMELEPYAEEAGFTSHGIVYEDTSNMESHGVKDRGATHTHQFLILQKE